MGFTLESIESNIISYRLCGVLTHVGSQIRSGHYVSEVRKGENWWKCDDDQIIPTSFDLLSKQAHGLLFKKM